MVAPCVVYCEFEGIHIIVGVESNPVERGATSPRLLDHGDLSRFPHTVPNILHGTLNLLLSNPWRSAPTLTGCINTLSFVSAYFTCTVATMTHRYP